MKKIILLLVTAVVSPCLFAQSAVNVSAIERAAKTAKDKKVSQVQTLEKQTLSALESFRKQALSYNYYDYNFMFQSMDGLREAYMALRAKDPSAARALAVQLNEPIKIANGNKTIKLVSYLNMETCTLWESEQVKFDAFGRALEADLKNVLPKDFEQALDSFRKYVQNAKELNSSYVLQSMMPAMDSFNDNVKKDPASARAMAKAFQQPIKAGWGYTVVASDFISDHACEVWPIQDELESFRDLLVKYSR